MESKCWRELEGLGMAPACVPDDHVCRLSQEPVAEQNNVKGDQESSEASMCVGPHGGGRQVCVGGDNERIVWKQQQEIRGKGRSSPLRPHHESRWLKSRTAGISRWCWEEWALEGNRDRAVLGPEQEGQGRHLKGSRGYPTI